MSGAYCTKVSRKPEGERSSGMLKIKLEHNIVWDLKAVDYEGDWKSLAQDKVT